MMLAHALVTEAPDDAPDDVWRDCYEHLYPGAHALVVVHGARPDRIAAGLRKAGFEMRDTIIIESGVPHRSWVPCFLFRKPIAEATVAEQVLTTGTGAINIEAARVKHSSAADFEKHKQMVDRLKEKGGSLADSWKNSSDLSGANEVTASGRWPANILLVHARGCTRTGTKKVDAPVINRFEDGMKPFGGGAGHAYTSTQTGDAEGKENVAVYACEPECPVGGLDGQSGDRKAGGAIQTPMQGPAAGSYHGGGSGGAPWEGYGDSGGASRFYKQFECKPDCPVRNLDDQSGVTRSGAMKHEVGAYDGESNTGFLRGRSGPSNQHGDAGGASRFYAQFNDWAPDVIDWLTALALPPGGIVLDPFREPR